MTPSGRRALRLPALAALLLVLLALLGEPGVSSQSPTLLLAGGCLLAVWCGWTFEFHPDALPRPRVVGPAVGLLLWSAVSTVASLSSYHSWSALSALTGATAVLLALSGGLREPGRWRWTAHLMVVAATLASLAAWQQLLAGDAPTHRLQGNFTNPDCFAVIGFVGFCLAGALLGQARGAMLGWLCLSAGINLCTVTATQSRSMLLGVLSALLVVGWLASRRHNRSLRKSALLGIGMVVLAGLFLMASTYLTRSAQRWGRLTSTSLDISVRQDLATGSLLSAAEDPLLGSGPGTFSLAYQRFRPLDMGTHEYANVAHNDFFQVLVETGLPGLFLWVLMHLSALALTFPKQHPMRAEGAWTGAALVGLLIYSLFNFATPLPATQMWWYALLGLAYALPHLESSEGSGPPVSTEVRRLGCSLLVLLGTLGCLFALRAWRAEGWTQKAQAQEQSLQWEAAMRSWSNAVWLEPGNERRLLGRARLAEKLALLLGDETWNEAAQSDLRAALASNPRSLRAALWGYRFYHAAGRVEEAHALLKRARAHSPYERHLARYEAAQLVQAGQLEEAAGLLASTGGSPELARLLVELELAQPGRGRAILEMLPSQAVQATVQRAVEEAQKRRLPSVIDRLYDLLPQDDDPSRSLLERARALGEAGDRKAASQLLRRLLKDGDPAHAAYETALVELSELEAAGSRDLLRAHLDAHPKASRVRLALAGLEGPEDPMALLSEGLRHNPSDSRLLEAAGDLYLAEGMGDVALDYYRRASRGRQDTTSLQVKIQQAEITLK